MGNLDGALREEMRDVLHVLHHERGSTTVLVTHDQGEAMALADYLVVMRGGRILQGGAPRQVYEEPANLFVAGFVGGRGMNLLPGVRRGEWVQLRDLPLRLRIGEFYHHLHTGARESSEADCFLGIRPEHVLLSEEGAPCVAEHTEALGAYNMLEARAGDSRVCAWMPSGVRFKAGEMLHLTVIPSGCRWFHAESGQALPWKTLEAVCRPIA
jgi:ABC-type sugar transport system ATPase subunit